MLLKLLPFSSFPWNTDCAGCISENRLINGIMGALATSVVDLRMKTKYLKFRYVKDKIFNKEKFQYKSRILLILIY